MPGSQSTRDTSDEGAMQCFSLRANNFVFGGRHIHYAWVTVAVASTMRLFSSSFRSSSSILIPRLVDSFGWSYGAASLSCTLPVFVAVVGFGTTTNFITATGYFMLYGLGMGSVILTLTLIIAIFKSAMVGVPRKMIPFIQPISATLMILAGSYIVYYWLTLGRDLL